MPIVNISTYDCKLDEDKLKKIKLIFLDVLNLTDNNLWLCEKDDKFHLIDKKKRVIINVICKGYHKSDNLEKCAVMIKNLLIRDDICFFMSITRVRDNEVFRFD